jgi:hypothetical protein
MSLDDGWPKVIIRQDFAFSADGPSIVIGRKFGGRIHVLGFDPEYHMPTWTEIEEGDSNSKPPTMVLDDDCARALLAALLQHYEGPPDVHNVRADLLHERGRVDKMIGAIIDIAQSQS